MPPIYKNRAKNTIKQYQFSRRDALSDMPEDMVNLWSESEPIRKPMEEKIARSDGQAPDGLVDKEKRCGI